MRSDRCSPNRADIHGRALAMRRRPRTPAAWALAWRPTLPAHPGHARARPRRGVRARATLPAARAPTGDGIRRCGVDARRRMDVRFMLGPMIVVYDADCGVCQASVAWVRKRDRRGRIEFMGNDAERLPAGVSREETEHTIVVLDGGEKLVRAEGMARILAALRGWGLAGALLRAPG